MRQLEHRIKLLEFLGELLRDISSVNANKYSRHSRQLHDQLDLISNSNPWFTPESVYRTISIWGETLDYQAINDWQSNYNIAVNSGVSRSVMVVMAGNIPLVGFHDFLCTILSGHRFIGKMSSRDKIIFPLLREWILEFDSAWADYILFGTEIQNGYDTVIATGSDNTTRLIGHMFEDKKMILRHNRNSIGLLTGNETDTDLGNLTKDILWYYGLGCRNLSLLFLPKGYKPDALIKKIKALDIFLPPSYKNNLNYQRAKAGVHQINYTEARNILFLDSKDLNAPIGLVHYTTYDNHDELELFRSVNSGQIQCTVGDTSLWEDVVPFGNSQKPGLADYADGIDTMQFLIDLS